jgi:tryptophan synthase alpha chain
MNRIGGAFEALRQSGGPGLIAYLTAGDPSLAETEQILRGLPAAGADLIEVGVPFSDPVADGPVIQRACERALRSGTTLVRVIEMVGRIRSAVAVPIVLFTYANPVERVGVDAFVARAEAAGIDGVLVVDLPIEEAGPLAATLTRRGLAPVFLVSPTTTAERVRRAAAMGSGFLYAVSRLGVTGARDALSGDAAAVVATIRAATALPVALGFGITTPQHVRAACTMADAAVVGSALVQVIAEAGTSQDVAARVAAHVRWLKGGAPS